MGLNMSFVAHIHAWKSWVRINVTKLNLVVKAPSTCVLKVLGLAFAHMYGFENFRRIFTTKWYNKGM